LHTGSCKEEIRDEYEVSGCGLLIINCIEIHQRLRGRGIGQSAIDRTIDIFGSGRGLRTSRAVSTTAARMNDPRFERQEPAKRRTGLRRWKCSSEKWAKNNSCLA
jgi:hypothetical protein